MRRACTVVMLAALALTACHKTSSGNADSASSRGLQVEAYDPPIPKAPVKGKLETLAQHPEDRPAAAPASSEIPVESSAAPKG